MEKRVFFAFFLTLLFLITWSYFVSKHYPPSPPHSRQKTKEEKRVIEIKEEREKLPQVEIGNFFITYSPTGGYVKKIKIKTYQEELLFKNIGFVPQDKEKKYQVKIEENKIIFSHLEEKKEFIFQGYNLKIKLSHPTTLLLFTVPLSPKLWDQRYQEMFYSQKNSLIRKSWKKVKKESLKEIEFVGSRDRYYCISLLKGNYQISWEKINKKEIYVFQDTPIKEINFYLGPQIEKELAKFGLENIIYYGFFHGIGVILIKLLYFFYFLTKNWGTSIVLLSIFIYFIIFPFTAKSTKAMRKIQELQPKIEELKKKYADNPQKLNKEILELYKKYGVNPLGGCLPLFFQLPIFIALYQVFFRFVELKKAPFLWIKDLSLPDHAFKLPFNYPLDYFNLLPVLIVILGLLQQKITSSKVSTDQKSMGLFLMVFLGIIFYTFPACLTLYWFIQNLLTLIYQSRLAEFSRENNE
jgi:YidC/Oxa1 family membrane protein insertase